MTSRDPLGTLRRMDTLKILLGATLALLLGALVVFTNRMNDGVENAPEQEIAKLSKQLNELEAEIERTRLRREEKLLLDAARQPAPTDAVTRAEAEEKVEEMEERMAVLEREAEEARAAAELAEQEALLLNGRNAEDRNKAARRVRLINEAMLIATVREWIEDPNFGGFAVLQVESPENMQTGIELAIRRNGGVLGKLRVAEVTAEGAVANPITRFAEVKPEPGDELILNSVVELAP